LPARKLSASQSGIPFLDFTALNVFTTGIGGLIGNWQTCQSQTRKHVSSILATALNINSPTAFFLPVYFI